MPATIRPALPADVPAIVEMIRELAEFENLMHEFVATPERLHAGLFGPRPYAEALVAELSGADANEKLVAFALFFPSYSTFLAEPGIYLEDLYVRPAYRGQGIGRQLLIAVGQVAYERGCGRYEWSVLDWNEAAIGFYRKLGAEMMGDWRRMRVAGDSLKRLAEQSGPEQAGSEQAGSEQAGSEQAGAEP